MQTQVTERIKADGIYNRCIKRVLDLVLAVTFAVILSPAYLILALAVVIDTGFPVFYRAERGGYRNKPFRIFKFRSMVKDADKIVGGTTARKGCRITEVGNVLRKTKLDEIPQLFNIIKGDMSFIGPRPELLRYTMQYEGDEMLIHRVRPGITDYSSIEFINLDEIVGDENADEMYEKYVLKRKNELRVKYAKTVSFTTDFKLLFITIWDVLKKIGRFVFKRKGAS